MGSFENVKLKIYICTHPSILYSHLPLHTGLRGSAGPYSSSQEAEAGLHPGQVHQFVAGPYRKTNIQPFTLTTYKLEFPIYLTCIFLDCWRKPKYKKYIFSVKIPNNKTAALKLSTISMSIKNNPKEKYIINRLIFRLNCLRHSEHIHCHHSVKFSLRAWSPK